MVKCGMEMVKMSSISRWFGLSSAISSVRNQQTNYNEREDEIKLCLAMNLLSKTKIMTQKENKQQEFQSSKIRSVF